MKFPTHRIVKAKIQKCGENSNNDVKCRAKTLFPSFMALLPTWLRTYFSTKTKYSQLLAQYPSKASFFGTIFEIGMFEFCPFLYSFAPCWQILSGIWICLRYFHKSKIKSCLLWAEGPGISKCVVTGFVMSLWLRWETYIYIM